MLKTFFTNFDMFGATPSLRMRGEPQTLNLCGGILSLLLILFFFYIFIIKALAIVNLQQIQAITTISKTLRSNEEVNTSLVFAVGIRGLDLDLLSHHFYIESYLETGINGQIKQTPFELDRCTPELWLELGDRYERAFNKYDMNERLCPRPGQTIPLMGIFNSEHNGENYTMLHIKFRPCPLGNINSSCQSNTSAFIQQVLKNANYILADFLLLSAAFNPHQRDPLLFYIQDHIWLTFTENLGTQSLVQLATYEVETDVGLTPVIQKQSLQGYYVSRMLASQYQIRAQQVYASTVVMLDAQYIEIQRKFGKLDDELSYVGGLLGLVIVFLGFFMLSFNEYRYELFVGETFRFSDGNKVKEEDFTFFTYLKYSIYDWVKLFCCCQLEWEDCKKIDESREEAIEQIDVQILLKRMSHLEQLVKFFITEEEDLCTYLTESHYIDHVRMRRKIIHYYDKIIQGNSPLTIENMYEFENLLSLKTQLLSHDNSFNSGLEMKTIKEQSLSFKDLEADEKLKIALEKGGKFYDDDEALDLDDEDREIQSMLMKAFYSLPERSREKMQQKIPLKILKRLKSQYEKEKERERMFTQFAFFKEKPNKKI